MKITTFILGWNRYPDLSQEVMVQISHKKVLPPLNPKAEFVARTEEEASRAEVFLQDLRLAKEEVDSPAITALMADLAVPLQNGSIKTAEGLRQAVLGNTHGIRYNLASKAGMGYYTESRQFKESGIKKDELKEIVTVRAGQRSGEVYMPNEVTIQAQYRSRGTPVPIGRKTKRGMPEKIYRAATIPAKPGNSGMVDNRIGMGLEQQTSPMGTPPWSVPDKGPADINASMPTFGMYNSSDATPFPILPGITSGRQGRGQDGELERLRKIEANYEKDKAALARQKVPALARSASHDVGHAEGSGEAGEMELRKAAHQYRQGVAEELSKRLGR